MAATLSSGLPRTTSTGSLSAASAHRSDRPGSCCASGPGAPAMRRSASVAAHLHQSFPAAPDAAAGLRRSVSFAPVRLSHTSRRSSVTTAASIGGAFGVELCGSWDEGDFGSALRDIEELAAFSQQDRTEAPETSEDAPPSNMDYRDIEQACRHQTESQLPPFEWNLPELSPSQPQAPPPWGFEKQRRRNTTGSGLFASGTAPSCHRWTEQVVPPGVDVLGNMSILGGLEEVYVILFGVGEGGEEGIYSLKSLSGAGVAVDTVIAFESEVDAERYAGLLEAVMVWEPSVCSISPVELVEFVMESGLDCRLQPEGSHIFPPDWNVPMGLTDWERTMRLRRGNYSVLSNDPEPNTACRIVEAEAGLIVPQLSNIDDIRQRLNDLYYSS